ncbi:hypothetical protein [Salmonella enterica]|uniref:hypothetical protein n=1 Tax=Salmonella enterica TaxID=28901 RepID=UPI001FF008B6|nr:hypothetical protein [Salmonella enterica]
MVPFALLLGVKGRWCAGARSAVTSKLLLTATVSTGAVGMLLPWLLEDKIISHDGGGIAMACWIAVLGGGEAVQRVSRNTTSQLLGNGGGTPPGWR